MTSEKPLSENQEVLNEFLKEERIKGDGDYFVPTKFSWNQLRRLLDRKDKKTDETLRQVLDEIESEIKSLKQIRENINPKYRNVITTNENQELRINASIVQLEKNKEIIKKAFGEELVNAL